MPNKSSFKTNEEYLSWYQNYREKNRLKVRAISRKHNRNWRLKNGRSAWYPEKEAARQILNAQIKRGLVKRLPCKECGEIKVQGHHEDYTQPLNVIWLCKKHHAYLHRKTI